ncbi:hypothetical protein NML43_06940 [Rhodopseudomonas palustris]|uniref:hypothetical protein n=1 Tax=Rhodopseudomonas palustris TaxID=1076 RepID=UPI0020CE2A0B|nr:hypothetical protein [Rhodopseudomonas palustris]MCP9626816.1 hypothetical protein [Rhodopseudomonas palustris]
MVAAISSPLTAATAARTNLMTSAYLVTAERPVSRRHIVRTAITTFQSVAADVSGTNIALIFVAKTSQRVATFRREQNLHLQFLAS